MIIDLHTHLWQSPDQLGEPIADQLRRKLGHEYNRLDASPVAHEAAMEPVDVAVVLGFRSRAMGADVPNDFLAEYVSRRPDRLIGFAGIDPTERDGVAQLRAAVDMGLSGLTISPASQDFHPEDTRVMGVYEAAEDLGLPILLHQGTHLTSRSRMAYAQPHLFDAVARQYPKLKLIIAHCGFPWVDETLVLTGKHANVYADMSTIIARPWHLYQMLLSAHQLDVTDRLLFGSDFPYQTPAEAIETLYTLNATFSGAGMPTIPRERIRGIIERDTLTALGLKRGPALPEGASPKAAQTTAKPNIKPNTKPNAKQMVKRAEG